MIRATIRTSRKLRHCEMCQGFIERGERYRDVVASPQHDDLGNAGWWRLNECVDCAERYGRPIAVLTGQEPT